MKPSFLEACWKKEMLEPTLVWHILIRAVLLPSCCSDSKVCSQRSYVLHLSLPENLQLDDLEKEDLIPTQLGGGGSPEW